MALLTWWSTWRLRRRFKEIGPGCQFLGRSIEIKGRLYAGQGCVFGNNLVLRTHKRGRIRFGAGVEVSDYALFNINSELNVGENTYIGPYTVLRDTNHVFQGTGVHWRLTPHITEPITIGRNCFLGAGTYIMPGVTIGDGAVIAPRSIVNRDIGENEIWAGSPARMAAHRLDPDKNSKLRKQLELVKIFGVTAPAGDSEEGPSDE
jgi:acetyltransferase-like isoleucine patch superfamily enzyme